MQDAFNLPNPCLPLISPFMPSFCFVFFILRETNFNKYDLKVIVKCFDFLMCFTCATCWKIKDQQTMEALCMNKKFVVISFIELKKIPSVLLHQTGLFYIATELL